MASKNFTASAFVSWVENKFTGNRLDDETANAILRAMGGKARQVIEIKHRVVAERSGFKSRAAASRWLDTIEAPELAQHETFHRTVIAR